MVYVRQDLGFWNHGGTVSEVISRPYSFEHLLNITILHYHLQVQANPKKIAQKKECYFLASLGETGLCHDIFLKFSLGPIEVEWKSASKFWGCNLEFLKIIK